MCFFSGRERVSKASRVREAAAAGPSVVCSHSARGRVQGPAELPPAAARRQGAAAGAYHTPAQRGL